MDTDYDGGMWRYLRSLYFLRMQKNQKMQRMQKIQRNAYRLIPETKESAFFCFL